MKRCNIWYVGCLCKSSHNTFKYIYIYTLHLQYDWHPEDRLSMIWQLCTKNRQEAGMTKTQIRTQLGILVRTGHISIPSLLVKESFWPIRYRVLTLDEQTERYIDTIYSLRDGKEAQIKNGWRPFGARNTIQDKDTKLIYFDDFINAVESYAFHKTSYVWYMIPTLRTEITSFQWWKKRVTLHMLENFSTVSHTLMSFLNWS